MRWTRVNFPSRFCTVRYVHILFSPLPINSIAWLIYSTQFFTGRMPFLPPNQQRQSTEWWGTGVVICLERGADLHMAQLMSLPLTVSCFSEIQIGFNFLVLADPGSPGKRAVKRVWLIYSYPHVCLPLCPLMSKKLLVHRPIVGVRAGMSPLPGGR